MENENLKLTQFAHGAGCGCKISPQVLETILQGNKSGFFQNLLVGNHGNDDASVLQINENECLISTVDFFTPIVDDPFTFGQVAAANALSDVYAMGGKPIMALALLGWPIEKLPIQMARLVMEGARSICESAGIPLAGGHSIDSTEPLFGLSVNGMVGVENLKRNNTAKSGDYIFLTKSLGTGILATAIKRNLINADSLGGFYAQITKLNKIGEVLGPLPEVHAVTDVTGFGLMGHLIEMAEGSNLSAEINFGQLSLMEGVKQLLEQNIIPDATYRNWNAYSAKTLINPDVNQVESFQILPDPQTNGGLLFSVAPSSLQVIQNLLREHGYENHVLPIGRFVDPMEKTLYVLP